MHADERGCRGSYLRSSACICGSLLLPDSNSPPRFYSPQRPPLHRLSLAEGLRIDRSTKHMMTKAYNNVKTVLLLGLMTGLILFVGSFFGQNGLLIALVMAGVM